MALSGKRRSAAATLRRIAALPPGDLARLTRLGLLRLALEPMLRLMPLPRVARRLGVKVSRSPAPPAPRLAASRLSESERIQVAGAARLATWFSQPEAGCLRHALLAGYALRKHAPVLRIGAATKNGSMTAHAWLECMGGRLDLGNATAYAPLREQNRRGRQKETEGVDGRWPPTPS